jgi:copper chaperone
MTILSVPDMTCGHCKASVEQALSQVPGTAPVAVDLTTHRVTLSDAAPRDAVLAALNDIGFPATLVAAS